MTINNGIVQGNDVKGENFERKKTKVVPKRKKVATVVENHVECQ